MANGKTIQIFLPTGDPKGIKKAEIKTDKIEIILSSKKDFLENKDIFDFNGIYILADSLQEEKPEIYIGKGKVKSRLLSHNGNKEFWNLIFAIRLKTPEGFNEGHTSYLEHYFIKTATNYKRSVMNENKQIPSLPNLEESIICELIDYINTSEILLSTLGLRIFQTLVKKNKKNQIFVCKTNNISYGEGEYTEDGFVVLKGSQCRKEFTKASKDSSLEKFRDKLIKNGILKEEGEKYLFEEDYIFSSPSYAASIILGRHANGWTEWKNKNNETLDEVYRKDKKDNA